MRSRYSRRRAFGAPRRAVNDYWVPFSTVANLAFNFAAPNFVNLAVVSNLAAVLQATPRDCTLLRLVGDINVESFQAYAATALDQATVGLILYDRNATAAQLNPADAALRTSGAYLPWIQQWHYFQPFNAAPTQAYLTERMDRHFDIRVRRKIRDYNEDLLFCAGTHWSTATTGSWGALISGRALIRVP